MGNANRHQDQHDANHDHQLDQREATVTAKAHPAAAAGELPRCSGRSCH